MNNKINYPLESHWTTDEIISVSEFYKTIELANSTGVDREELLYTYREFKKIVPSKMEEKQLGRAYEDESGFSIYRTIKFARENNKDNIKINQ